MFNYKSPISMITEQVTTAMQEAGDKQILTAVQKIGINIDKEELLKALQYDRDSYKKGYDDAKNEFIDCGWRDPSVCHPLSGTPVLIFIATKAEVPYLSDYELGDTYVARYDAVTDLYVDQLKPNHFFRASQITKWAYLPRPRREDTENS